LLAGSDGDFIVRRLEAFDTLAALDLDSDGEGVSGEDAVEMLHFAPHRAASQSAPRPRDAGVPKPRASIESLRRRASGGLLQAEVEGTSHRLGDCKRAPDGQLSGCRTYDVVFH
jgi:hypothetical protein